MMNKVGIELTVEAGGFVSGIASAERSIESLTQAMEQAKKEGRDEDFVRLQIQRDTLKASTSGFNKDTQKLFNTPHLQAKTANGLSGIKLDSESGQLFKDLTSNIKKLSGVMAEQLNSGDFEGASKTAFQLQQEQGKYKKAVDAVAGPAGTQPVQNIQNLLKAIGIDRISNAINAGFSQWVNSLDRSGIINAYGSGDILGGQIAEERRKANLTGGATQAVTSTVGGALMMSGNPYAMAGGALISLGGSLFNTLLQKKPNEEATEAAYAGLWQQRSADAMNLVALMGGDAVVGDRNMVRETHDEAADIAAKFGYSAEEGMRLLSQAVQQGLNGDRAKEVTEQVFHYERGTGADRGTLASVANTAARYGMGDALKAGWGGLGASGMSPGQYNEYLRAMQRVMEDGVSKGFTRASEQVAQNFTMIAQIGGDNKTWQGEGGARRYQSMSAGLENAVGLNSSTDIHVYRAARQILEKGGKSASWVDVNRLAEQGLGGDKGTELQYRTWAMDYKSEGGGREGFVSRQVQRGQSYDAAAKMWDHFAPIYEGAGKNIDAALKVFESLGKTKFEEFKNKPLPNASSPELEWAQLEAQTANIVVQTGHIKFDELLPMLVEGRKKAEDELREAMAGSKPYKPTDTANMTPDEALRASQADYAKALKKGTNEEFEEAARRAEKARVETVAPRRNIFDEIPNIQNGVSMTIPDFFRKGNRREDKTAENKMFNTFDTALRSGDEGQIQTAHDTFRRLQSVPKEVRERWDSTNAINPLADSNGMRELLAGINRLIEIEEKNGAMRFIIEP